MKSSRSAFPTGVFLASVCVIAVIICLGGCLVAARTDTFAYGLYALALLACSLGGGCVVALISARANRGALRESERLRRENAELRGEMKNLAESAERREEFIGSFAHELKTPLTAIIGYADMLRSREMTPKNRFTAAGYIFSEGDVWIEPDLFKTLMINIIDNARKASRRGQTVEFFGKRTEDGYAFYVRDHGRGMKKEDLSRITEPFYMIDKSRSRAQNGAGLGLALCQRIAELHETELEFESEPGKGTTVRVALHGEASDEKQ